MEEWHTLSRSYGVILPSSLMIVSSNAFVYSTSLLGQRQYLGTVSIICRFFQNPIYSIRLIPHKSFSHRLVLQGRSINLEAVTLSINTISLRRGGKSLFRYLCQHSHLGYHLPKVEEKKGNVTLLSNMFYLRSMDLLTYSLHSAVSRRIPIMFRAKIHNYIILKRLHL